MEQYNNIEEAQENGKKDRNHHQIRFDVSFYFPPPALSF